MDALSHLRNPVLWTNLVDMDIYIFIETQALTSTQQEEAPTYSIGGSEEKESNK